MFSFFVHILKFYGIKRPNVGLRESKLRNERFHMSVKCFLQSIARFNLKLKLISSTARYVENISQFKSFSHPSTSLFHLKLKTCSSCRI